MKFYVYVYYDPRGWIAVYVGKGKGRRAYDHLSRSKTNPGLTEAIAEWRALGFNPKPVIVARFETSKEALAEERRLVALYGRRCNGTGSLFNLSPIDNSGNWDDDEYRERHTNSLRRRNNNPVYRKKNLDQLQRLNNDPIACKKRADSVRRANKLRYPEAEKRREEKARLKLERQREREAKHEEKRRLGKEKHALSVIRLNTDPEILERQKRGYQKWRKTQPPVKPKQPLLTPEQRSERVSRQWKDHEFRKRNAEGWKRLRERRGIIAP